MDWIEIKEKPPQNICLIVKTNNGSIYRGKYMLTTFVKTRQDYDCLFNSYVICGDPFEVFIPHTYEFTPDWKDLMQSITHWIIFKDV